MCSISKAPPAMDHDYLNSSANPTNNCPCLESKGMTRYLLPEELRKFYEEWDMRILVLYILLIQLSLHLLGRRRKKTGTMRMLISVNVWALYLLADLVATIALGKLSKLNSADDVKQLSNGNNGDQRKLSKGSSSPGNHHPTNVDGDMINAVSLLRSLWAPIILFYLGGPDTITVLKLEENHLWLRHLIGLLTQGLRTGYVLFVTWAASWLSILAVLLLLPGIIRYGERIWVMKSRARGKYEGFVRISPDKVKSNNTALPNAKVVLEAYSHFQTLKPHVPSYACDKSRLDNLVKDFHGRIGSDNVYNTFKLIEIELGFMFDVLFSKVGTIFTVWGCILRLVSFSCLVGVFVGFFLVKKPDGKHLKVDLPITVILLLGAIFIEVAGALDQLVSDWAVVWAFKYQNKLAWTPVFPLQEFILSKRKRWSGLVGQFSFLNYCNKYKPTKFDKRMETLCGRETMLNMKLGSPPSKVKHFLKELIINQLLETAPSVSDVGTLQPSTMTRGKRTLENYGCLQAFKWGIDELEFVESIVIWHIATDICCHSEDPNFVRHDQVVKAAKTLSNYMMHLLLICPSRLPICDTGDKVLQACADHVKCIFEGESIASNAEACKLLLEKPSQAITVNRIRTLATDLNLKESEIKWKILSNVWVEMLCYAASHCAGKHHVQELRHGGEFLTQVWLLLMHFCVTKELEHTGPPTLPYASEAALKNVNELTLGA